MKRKAASHASGGARKKARRADAAGQSDTATRAGPGHPVLRRLYPKVVTLRHYLLSKLPKSSKNRRRRISQLGPAQDDAPTCDVDNDLVRLLDSTLVGCSDSTPSTQEQSAKERGREIERFTQKCSQSISGGTFKPGYFLQCEVGQSPLHAIVHGIISRSGR